MHAHIHILSLSFFLSYVHSLARTICTKLSQLQCQCLNVSISTIVFEAGGGGAAFGGFDKFAHHRQWATLSGEEHLLKTGHVCYVCTDILYMIYLLNCYIEVSTHESYSI